MAAAPGTNKLKLLYFLLLLVAALMAFIAEAGVSAARTLSPPSTTFPAATDQPAVSRARTGRSSSSSSEEAPAPGGGISRAPPPAAERRTLIGSKAPTCTYNECRGCRRRCSVQEVPVDANDPMNSAYHYRCICHF
ncbi:uncharacterized protein LOC121055210 [Oryza brachyantha]|uniref:uncharacterized protein LOC121055210 n=1 Tax=Oryza brachyantha TaxID=4533 RepID=UPI001ADA6217|nr:uncharacterized protein LOC121055210 [Oryza brachyantha]